MASIVLIVGYATGGTVFLQVSFLELPTLLHLSSSNGFVHLLLALADVKQVRFKE